MIRDDARKGHVWIPFSFCYCHMLDGGMRSPWEENSRKTERNDMFQGEQGNEFLGQLLQRSTSAPPLPSETNDAIGGQQDEEDTESVSEALLRFMQQVFI